MLSSSCHQASIAPGGADRKLHDRPIVERLVVVDFDPTAALRGLHKELIAEINDAEAAVTKAKKDLAAAEHPARVLLAGRVHPLVARRRALIDEGDVDGDAYRDVTARLVAADRFSSAAALVLALSVAQVGIWWDSDETLRQAARRFARDVAARRAPYWQDATGDDVPDRYWPDVIAHITGRTDLAADVAVIAAAYLASRDDLNAELARRDVPRETVTAAQIADDAGIDVNTWRSYVARDRAPRPDTGTVWYRETADAWRLTRTD